MSFTLHTSGSAIATAGANVNSTITASGSVLAQWSDEAEALCCATARVDVVTNYGSLNAQGKVILAQICNSYVAQNIINYEPEAIGLTGASLRLNVLQSRLSDGLSKISEDKIKTYLQIT